jgi:hypothetical protein
MNHPDTRHITLDLRELRAALLLIFVFGFAVGMIIPCLF